MPLVRCASAFHPQRLPLYVSTLSLHPASPSYCSLIILPLSSAPSLLSSPLLSEPGAIPLILPAAAW